MFWHLWPLCKNHSQCVFLFVCAQTNHCHQSLHSTQYALDTTMILMAHLFLSVDCEVKSHDLEPIPEIINMLHKHNVSCSVIGVWKVWWHQVHSQSCGLAKCFLHMNTLPNSLNNWESTMTHSEGIVCQMSILMALHHSFLKQ